MTLDQARASAWPPKVEPVHSALRIIEAFDVTFSGFGAQAVKAWLHRPVGSRGNLPVVVRYPGYGGGRGLPHQVSHLVLAGYACLSVDARGQGASGGWVGETTDNAHFGPSAPGLMTSGIRSPETYYFRRLYTDAVLAIDAVRQMDDVSSDQVVVAGGSQGGGIALAVAGLADGISAVMADVPFMCDIPRGMAVSDFGPYQELVHYLATHREEEGHVFEVLAYFDAAVLAAAAHAPALFSVGLMDHWCPPSTVYAAFNNYGGPKELRSYPYNDHEGGQFHQEQEQLTWLPKLVPLPPSSDGNH
jgi:cephalosporin-C deacetylase